MSVEILLQRAKGRVPLIYQSEVAECGLACLAMVASYHGYKRSLSQLRCLFDVSQRGSSLQSIIGYAEKLGLRTRALKVPLEDVRRVRLPAILHWDLTHFVVLKSVSKNKFEILDPAQGRRVISQEEFSKYFTGVALELEPDRHFEKKRDVKRLSVWDLWGKLEGYKRGIAQIVFLSFFIQLLMLINPFFLQLVVDEVLTRSNHDLLLILAIGFGGLVIVSAVAGLLRQLVLIYAGSAISFQVASNIFAHLVRLPITYFEKRHSGEVLSRFQSFQPIKQMLTEGVVGVLIDGVMAFTTLLLLFVYSPFLAIVTLGAWLGYFVIRMMLFHSLREKQEAAIQTAAKENSLFLETIRAITALKLYGGEQDRIRHWQNHYADNINADAGYQRVQGWLTSSSHALNGLELIIIVFLAARMVMAGEFTVGMLFAYIAYRTNFATNASQLIEKLVEFRMVGLHLDRLADVILEKSETPNVGRGASKQTKLVGGLELRGVSYRYSDEGPFILKDLDVRIEAGESVAIIGPTGCGKSTLIKIMTTLCAPASGDIYVDGKLLCASNYQEYRSQIAVIMQDDVLLSGTILSNITFFSSDIDIDRAIAAADAANILEDILNMPMQFESLIGDMGVALSGGQKQRITIARALYRQPKILFMDEATSSLDVETERKVSAEIRKLGITRIIVAHRPETIKTASRIIELKNGQIAEVDRSLFVESPTAIFRHDESFTPQSRSIHSEARKAAST